MNAPSGNQIARVAMIAIVSRMQPRLAQPSGAFQYAEKLGAISLCKMGVGRVGYQRRDRFAVRNRSGNFSGNLGATSAGIDRLCPAYVLAKACTNKVARSRNAFDLLGFSA